MANQKSKLKFWILVSMLAPCTLHLAPHAYAQDKNKLVTFTKQIIEAKTNENAYATLAELADLYFKENKYNELVEFLSSLANQKKTLEPVVNYYIGFARYSQLKHLEEAQGWDEYFSQGNTYREQITQSLQKTIDASAPLDFYHIYAKLILWKFHRDQQDALNESAISELMDATLEYAQNAKNLIPLKDVAGELSSYGEKTKASQIYRAYVQRLVSSDIKDEELNKIALDFYKEGNLDLAESIYDVYIERIQTSYAKEKLIPLLIDIARNFSYKDEGPKDPLYAEKVFGKIEEVGGKDSFSEELIYLRAFNLEKAKDFPLSKDIYIELLRRYPQNAHVDEAEFKIGIIYTYVLRDLKSGREYFEKLANPTAPSVNPEPAAAAAGPAQKETLTPRLISPQVISSLYQLGLLSQWEQDFVLAKEYYNKLLERAKDGFQETVTKTLERLREIEEAKPIEYNLKTFLDVSLKAENAMFDMTKVDLRSNRYKANKDQDLIISSTPYTTQSGCMQVEIQYLWSGDIGKSKPGTDQPSFTTQYSSLGTKEINLVIVSPTGIIDRNIDLVDVY